MGWGLSLAGAGVTPRRRTGSCAGESEDSRSIPVSRLKVPALPADPPLTNRVLAGAWPRSGNDNGGAALGRPSAGMRQEMVPDGLKSVPDGAVHVMVHGVQLLSDGLWNSSWAESDVSRPNVTVPGLLGAV